MKMETEREESYIYRTKVGKTAKVKKEKEREQKKIEGS